jgi:hypothetical protein
MCWGLRRFHTKEFAMLKPENQTDKERFEKLKEHEVARGRGEEQATKVAAKEVKQLRDQEGKNK